MTDIVKQGGILGSPICSAATAEYCETNKGISLGTALIASLAFVDDIADLSTSFDDAVQSHKNALAFAKRKKLQLAPDKCYIMLMQPRNKGNQIPKLEVEGGQVSGVSSIVYLGDVFNDKGNNDDLVADRVKREASLGYHTLSVFVLLHNAILLPSMLFNAQAWSNISQRDNTKLTTIQLRYLKKMMGVRQATSNAFTFLELGVLPIKYEIHKRQLSFLHHIVNLAENDPVKMVWRHQTNLPDHRNWWSDVSKLMETYSINYDEQEIANMSKAKFKRIKESVLGRAFSDLQRENSEKTRTQNIIHNKFEAQKYITHMHPTSAKIIFKCREKTLKIKEHMKFKFDDMSCRWCGVGEETLSHVSSRNGLI